MSIIEMLRIVFFEEEEFVIPICDEENSCPLPLEMNVEIEDDPDSCVMPNGDSENIHRMKQILKDLPSGEPKGTPPDFKLKNRSEF